MLLLLRLFRVLAVCIVAVFCCSAKLVVPSLLATDATDAAGVLDELELLLPMGLEEGEVTTEAPLNVASEEEELADVMLLLHPIRKLMLM